MLNRYAPIPIAASTPPIATDRSGLYTNGTPVFETNLFYNPQVVEVWVWKIRAVTTLTPQTLNWQYVHGYHAQLLVLGKENVQHVKLALACGHTLEVFAKTFPIQEAP